MSRWSSLDLMRLQALFESKATLSEMSSILKRSPTSINKALARSGIRTFRKDKNDNQERPLYDEKVWVPLKDVQKYLKHYLPSAEGNPTRILLMANRLRMEKNLPPFYVEDVTW